MNLVLALVAALASLASWVTYMGSVPSGRVPPRPIGHLSVQTAALVASAVAMARAGADASVLVPALVASVMGALFLFLLSQRKTPIGDLRIAVGEPMLAFTALDRHGQPFTAEDLVGRRTLFKFFRGHW
ncbi:MAG: hypothetical protein EP330_05000 [Deltaproteobacteria bacterium]|nr:MAG: hypothetical protein EP330_05000 [Deltaproteobacteria bacterium]